MPSLIQFFMKNAFKSALHVNICNIYIYYWRMKENEQAYSLDDAILFIIKYLGYKI